MAIAKTAQGIISIHGKFAGNYFKKDPSGQHIQSMPRSIHVTYPTAHTHHSPLVAKGSRGILTRAFSIVCSEAKILSGKDLEAWIYFASITVFEIIAGTAKLLNWRQWFIHANVVRVARNLEILRDPYRWYNFYRWLDYNVRNTLWHDIDGLWSEEGTFDQRPFYRLNEKPYFLWCKDYAAWYISEFPGVIGTSGWRWNVPTQPGEYAPYGAAEGTFTIWSKRPFVHVD